MIQVFYYSFLKFVGKTCPGKIKQRCRSPQPPYSCTACLFLRIFAYPACSQQTIMHRYALRTFSRSLAFTEHGAIVPLICLQVRACTPYQSESHFPFFCYLFSENTIFQNTKRSFIRLRTTLFPAKPETQAEMNRNARNLYYHKYTFRAFLCFLAPVGASCTYLHTIPRCSAGAPYK